MNKKILTIAVPSYNMEKLLPKCLDSFIVEEILDDIEVIIVNDGSKDKTLEVAQSYVEKYPNVFKVIDKENGGHGSGINYGVKNATGKFFKLVDADDWVMSENMVEYIKMLKEHPNVDMFINDYNFVYEPDFNIESPGVLCQIPEEKKYKEIEFWNYIHKAMHALTYKTEILAKFKFSEKCFYEDQEYVNFPILYVNTVYVSDLNVYQYRLGRQGQSVSTEGFYKHRLDHCRISKNLFAFYNDHKNELSDCKKEFILDSALGIAHKNYMIFMEWYKKDKSIIEDIREYDNWLKENSPEEYALLGQRASIRAIRKKNFKNMSFCYNLIQIKRKLKNLFKRG